MENAIKLQVLKEEYHNCKRCPVLVETRTQVVFGAGDADSCKLVILGEAPGKVEDEIGVPFVGRSGKLLDEFLESIGVRREEVFITNTILCRPPNNRNPASDELSNCRGRLDETLRILSPKVVITLGNFATQYFLETKVGITKLRGKVYEKRGSKVIPMQHPAVLLYNGNSPAKRKEFEDDFALVKEILDSKKIEKEEQKKLFE